MNREAEKHPHIRTKIQRKSKHILMHIFMCFFYTYFNINLTFQMECIRNHVIYFTYLSGKEPLKNIRKEGANQKTMEGDWINLLSHSKQANHISSVPVESVGNNAMLPIEYT